MNKAQASVFLGCTEKSLYTWVQVGLLPRRKLGRAYDWTEEEVLAAASIRGWQRRLPELPPGVPAMPSASGVAELIALVHQLTTRVDGLEHQMFEARHEERDRSDALSQQAHRLGGKLEWHLGEHHRVLDDVPDRVEQLEMRVNRQSVWISGFYDTSEEVFERHRQRLQQQQHEIAQQEHARMRVARRNG